MVRADASNVQASRRGIARQKGFTLVELGVVAVILIVLVVLALPKIEDKFIEGRIPTAGRDLLQSISRLRSAANITQSPLPFATLPSMDNLFRDGHFAVNGSVVKHQLGTAQGEVVVTTLASGAAASITLWGLSPLNCPNLFNQVQKAADVVEVGTSGTALAPTAPSPPSAVPTTASATVVKTPTAAYDAGKVVAACSEAGSHNFLRFYVNG